MSECKNCPYYGLVYIEKPLGEGYYTVGCKEPDTEHRPDSCKKGVSE